MINFTLKAFIKKQTFTFYGSLLFFLTSTLFTNSVNAQTTALDPSFNTTGKQTTDFGGNDLGNGMAVQGDGKIVVVGRVPGSAADFGLVRYNTDGTLDGTFGTGGKVITDISGGAFDEAFAVAIQSDGKIVVVGQTNASGTGFAVVRYTSSGALDNTFNTTGIVITTFLNSTQAFAVAIQTDQKIVVAGSTFDPAANNIFAIARYNTDGSLDNNFDADGKLTTAFYGGDDAARCIAIQSDGKIVVAGYTYGSHYDFAIARYNSTDGSLDNTFDTDGKQTTDFNNGADKAYGVAMQSDGKIVVTGQVVITNQDIGVARYNTNGSLDNTFDADGKVATDINTFPDLGSAVAIQADGQIVVGGYGFVSGGSGNDFVLLRYNSTDGSLDNTFNGNGKIVTDFAGTSDRAAALVLSGSRFYLAGTSNGDFGVAVYLTTYPVLDYFRSHQTGDWNNVNTWETSTDPNFTSPAPTYPAGHTPTFSDNAITIQSLHTVTITAAVTTDQTTVNSGGALVVNPNVVLTLNDGSSFDLTVAGTMTIQSDATGTGSIGNSGTATTSGNITVERYISSLNNRAYRLLGPSVTTATSIHANWQEGAVSNADNPKSGFGTHITGTQVDQTNGFDGTLTGQGSLFTYNQGTNAYVAATNTNTSTLEAKIGYLIYIRGDRTPSHISASATSSNTTLRATGQLLTGTQTFTGLADNGGFSLVTNPYASAIKWDLIYSHFPTSNSINFESYYTYLDPNIGDRGGYVTVTNGGAKSIVDPANSGTVNGSLNIQSGQAFFVKTKAGITNPSLVIQESDKSTTNNIDVFRTAQASQKFTVSLYYNSATMGRRIADGVTALYDNSYNAALDGNDAQEISNFDENIAIDRAGKHLSIEERPTITGTESLPLFMNNMKQQVYEFEFIPTGFAPNMVAKLTDKYTGAETYLNTTSSTVVPFSVTTDAASSAADRFTVVFSPSVALPVTLTSIKAYQKNAGVQVEWIVQQESNMDRYEVERSANGQNFTKIGSVNANGNNSGANTYNLFDAAPLNGTSYYRIHSVDKNGQATNSAIVKVNNSSNSTNAAPQVTVTPNPVEGNSVSVQFTNLTKGRYTIVLSNKLGQQIASKIIDHQGGSATETLEVQALTTGLYQLKVTGNGTTVTRQVVKK